MFSDAWNAASSLARPLPEMTVPQPRELSQHPQRPAQAHPALPRYAPVTPARKSWVMPDPKAVQYETPLTFAADTLKVRLWSKQEEVLAALPDHQRVAVKSGNGLGKGFSAATNPPCVQHRPHLSASAPHPMAANAPPLPSQPGRLGRENAGHSLGVGRRPLRHGALRRVGRRVSRLSQSQHVHSCERGGGR